MAKTGQRFLPKIQRKQNWGTMQAKSKHIALQHRDGA